MISSGCLLICAALASTADSAGVWQGWTPELNGKPAVYERRADGDCAVIRVDDAETPGFPRYIHSEASSAGTLYEGRVEAASRNARDGYGAYGTVEFLDAEGKRINFAQSSPATRGEQLDTLSIRAAAPQGTARALFCLVFNGKGEAWFATPSLRVIGHAASTPPQGTVTLTCTEEVLCPSLVGLGFEDDGWFYNEDNKKRGVTEDDYALRENRIAEMDPDWVRMFFWYHDWNPSGDWKTFDWETDNMRSHYRTLDLYQRIGAAVTVTGVEWMAGDPWTDPAGLAHTVGALFEQLIKVRGYTCAKTWILTNEPNTHFTRNGHTFAEFVALHTRVRKEFIRRGLDVKIIGSDDTNDGMPWFAQGVRDDAYYKACDAFSSHIYQRPEARPLAPYFYQERIDLLRERAKRGAAKPLVIGEFGFQDARSDGPNVNPVMEEYPYALWTMGTMIEGLNRGVAGYAIWCVQASQYPGIFMNYGLWNYKDRGWSLRSVFHALKLFTRNTDAGNKVYRVQSSAPDFVRAVRIGARVFWSSECDTAMALRVENFRARRMALYTEKSLPADDGMIAAAEIDADGITLPARSFGMLEE